MYVTEKTLRNEVRSLHSKINEAASDLGGDITYLHEEVVALKGTVAELQAIIQQLQEQLNES
jgi:peptidoglycan hydrolase CwlO-like protein